GWLIWTYFAIVRPRRKVSGSRSRRFYRGPFPPEKAPPFDPTDAGQQLKAVMAASFGKRRLLSRPEYQAFKIIEADIAAARRGYRVFAQTSLGEVLKSPASGCFSLDQQQTSGHLDRG